jgi:hypothetical protein
MRFIYLGRIEAFDRSSVGSFIGGIKQFNDQMINGFKPESTSRTYVLYGFFAKRRLRYRQRRIFSRYKDRDSTSSKDAFTLSTEEMATVFHMPDQSVVAPSMRRTDARRSGAPSNLPV